MDLPLRPPNLDRTLARIAGGLLGCSLIASGGLVFVAFEATTPIRLLRNHPVGVTEGLGVIGLFVAAAVSLSKLERLSVENPQRLWAISLLATAAIVVVVVAAVRDSAGLVLFIPELACVLVQIVALSWPREREHVV